MIQKADFISKIKLENNRMIEVCEDFKKQVIEFAYEDFAFLQRRDYQERIVFQAISYMMLGLNPLILSPTGSGKTNMGLIVANAMSKLTGENISWSAHRKVLLDQAKEDAIGYGMEINAQSIFQNPNTLVRCGISIEDEAHRHVCKTGERFRFFSKKENHYCLGLSATPVRLDKASLMFDLFINEVTTQQLIDEGYLSQYDYYRCHMEWTPQNVADLYLEDPERWGQTVIFMSKIEHTQELYDILSNANVRVGMVSSEMSEEDQDEATLKFKNGEYDVLVNIQILTEGFDYPNLKTVFMKPSSKNITIQMGGRVLRLSEIFPVKNIIQGVHSKSYIYNYSKEATPNEVFNIKRGEKGDVVIKNNGMIKLSDGIMLATELALSKLAS